MALHRLNIVSDIHYAGPAERARGDYRGRHISPRWLRLPVRFWQHFLWERDPFAGVGLLDRFVSKAPDADLVIANGDYSCDSAFVGVCDPAALESTTECLAKLRGRFGTNFFGTIGDHELGKIGFGTRQGGLRLASFARCIQDLALAPFWRLSVGRYVLMGVTSSLIALPVFFPELLEDERAEWERLRETHLAEIRAGFSALRADERVLLFCHDPTALLFLWREEAVRSRLSQIEQTVIGHLHSQLIFATAQRLAGMPRIHFLGPFARRVSTALGEARHWKAFRVRLCPSLRGIQLLKDGGFLTAELDANGNARPQFRWHRLVH